MGFFFAERPLGSGLLEQLYFLMLPLGLGFIYLLLHFGLDQYVLFLVLRDDYFVSQLDRLRAHRYGPCHNRRYQDSLSALLVYSDFWRCCHHSLHVAVGRDLLRDFREIRMRVFHIRQLLSLHGF